MWEPRRLTNLWAFSACYRDTFTFIYRVLETWHARTSSFLLLHAFALNLGLVVWRALSWETREFGGGIEITVWPYIWKQIRRLPRPSFTRDCPPTPPPVGHLLLVFHFGVVSSSPRMAAECCRQVSGLFTKLYLKSDNLVYISILINKSVIIFWKRFQY
jgi:hypothetical protein